MLNPEASQQPKTTNLDYLESILKTKDPKLQVLGSDGSSLTHQSISIPEHTQIIDSAHHMSLSFLQAITEHRVNGTVNTAPLQEAITNLSQIHHSLQEKAHNPEHNLIDQPYFYNLDLTLSELLPQNEWLEFFVNNRIKNQVNELLLISMLGLTTRNYLNLQKTRILSSNQNRDCDTLKLINDAPLPERLLRNKDTRLYPNTDIATAHNLTSLLEDKFENLYHIILGPTINSVQFTEAANSTNPLLSEYQQHLRCQETFYRYNIELEEPLPIANIKATRAWLSMQIFQTIVNNLGLEPRDQLKKASLETCSQFSSIHLALDDMMT